MSLSVGVGKGGVFAPRQLQGFAECRLGWGWVGDTLGSFVSRWFGLSGAAELMHVLYAGFQLERAKPLCNRWCAGGTMQWGQCVQISLPLSLS